jgi:hypothetical protein
MNIRTIKKLVEQETELDLTTKTRKQEYIYARAVYYKLSRENTLSPLRDIGRLVNKDHAGVINGLKSFETITLSNDNTWMDLYSKLSNEIRKYALNKIKNDNPEKYYRHRYKNLQQKYKFLITRLRQLDSKFADREEFKMEEV